MTPSPPTVPAAASAATRPRARTGRRQLVVGIGASLALHALAFLLVRFHQPAPRGPFFHEPVVPWLARATELVELEVVGGDVPDAVAPERPRPQPDVELPAFPPPEPVAPEERAAAQPRVPSVRERLSASEQAARLALPPRAPLDPRAPLRTLDDEVSALAYQLGIYNDSLVADWAREARATDWTIRDGDGGRWGVSPGRIHLGKLTLPLPLGFAPSQDVLARMDAFQAIQRQAADAAVRATLEERGRAVRERRDAARRGGGGG